MRQTIAPVLTRHLGRGGTLQVLDGLEEARAEFRALLAVARAADRLVNIDRTRHRGEWPGSWLEAVGKTQRALARLAKTRRGR